jgi:transcriptional regulator with XRE-family HTH domain
MIRELRQMQGMTLAVLAARLATHSTPPSRIERERLLPRSDFLLRCIAALGADMIILRIRNRPTECPPASNDVPP